MGTLAHQQGLFGGRGAEGSVCNGFLRTLLKPLHAVGPSSPSSKFVGDKQWGRQLQDWEDWSTTKAHCSHPQAIPEVFKPASQEMRKAGGTREEGRRERKTKSLKSGESYLSGALSRYAFV